MVALQAQIRTDAPIIDERSAARRTLRLKVPTSSTDATCAMIHNLSETGLLLETATELQVGEALQVELPHAGPTTAVVVWVRGRYTGCEFAQPVSRAAVSAALLRAPVQATLPPGDTAREFSLHSASDRRSRRDVSPAVLLLALLIASAVAALFVVSLLALPFAAY